MLKIGVLLPGEVGHLGEFLADARALETAGAHALWLTAGLGLLALALLQGLALHMARRSAAVAPTSPRPDAPA